MHTFACFQVGTYARRAAIASEEKVFAIGRHRLYAKVNLIAKIQIDIAPILQIQPKPLADTCC